MNNAYTDSKALFWPLKIPIVCSKVVLLGNAVYKMSLQLSMWCVKHGVCFGSFRIDLL